MKKLIFTCSIFVLLTGASCANRTQDMSRLPSSPTDTIRPTTASQFNPFTANQATAFAEESADFIFEFPNDWIYKFGMNSEFQKNFPNAKEWYFSYEGKNILSVGAPPHELAVDHCYQGNVDDDVKVQPTKYKIYPTNDAKTTVAEEVCGFVTYIYWLPGYKVEKIATAPSDALSSNYHLIIFYSPDYAASHISSTPPVDYLSWIDRIAASIKIK